jgi:hypothetical protein
MIAEMTRKSMRLPWFLIVAFILTFTYYSLLSICQQEDDDWFQHGSSRGVSELDHVLQSTLSTALYPVPLRILPLGGML